METFRDSAFGQLVRYISNDRLLQYPEERNSCLLSGLGPLASAEKLGHIFENHPHFTKNGKERKSDLEIGDAIQKQMPVPPRDSTYPTPDLTNATTKPTNNISRSESKSQVAHDGGQNLQEAKLEVPPPPHIIRSPYSTEAGRSLLDPRSEAALKAYEKSDHGDDMVTWYGEDDLENPQNWSQTKKSYVLFVICIYTWGVYVGSSIYSASEQGVQERFGVKNVVAALGISLYVLGYGTGPMFFSPLSEIPILGRNLPYVVSMFIYTMLCIATPQVNNIAGLLVLRFLQGFFGSPVFATGGASIGDIYSPIKVPYALTFWVVSAYCGPALGPLIAGYAVMAENWRWSMWELLWIAIPIFFVVVLMLPETSADTILLRRAHRLRKLTGNYRLKSESEIIQSEMTAKSIVYEALIIPLKITIMDPAIMFTNIYTSIVYSIFYSFFEAFPIVFMDIYGFSLGGMGLAFLVVCVACTIAVVIYWLYLFYVFEPRVRLHGFGAPESRLYPSLFAAFGPPIGLMIFGWTSRAEIHWVVPLIGVTIYCGSVFILLQCIFTYIPVSYPKYEASLFASNDFIRSAMATGSVLFGRPLYSNLGIGPGISVLAGITVLCIGGIYGLYFYGGHLRARSKFAADA